MEIKNMLYFVITKSWSSVYGLAIFSLSC